MSTGMKVLLVLCALAGLSLVLCCGVSIWFARSAMTVTDKPDEIRAITEEIATIELPEGYEPQFAVSINMMMKMHMVGYGPDGDDENVITLMQMKMPGGISDEDAKRSFREQNQQQGNNADIQVEKRETRTFTIDGEECEFEFITGTDPETKEEMHQVIGVFPGRNGTAVLMIMGSDQSWDEEQAIQIIKSISVNGEDAPADAKPAAPEAVPAETLEPAEPGSTTPAETPKSVAPSQPAEPESSASPSEPESAPSPETSNSPPQPADAAATK